jgi:large-conductance mechanosensitive channel
MDQDLNDLFILSISVYMGSVLTGLFNSLTRDIFMPLLSPYTDSFDEITFTVLGRTVRVSSFLTQFANLIIGLTLVYFTFKGFKKFIFERR